MASSRRSAEAVERALIDAPGTSIHALSRPWIVAFSGGLDSTVLLHSGARVLGVARIVAVHVHHGLQRAADAWPAHCESFARSLGVAFDCIRLSGAPSRGESLEAWAREWRYRALADAARGFGAQGVLTAHHADDQVETLLMRRARGAGVHGMVGIEPDTMLAGVRVLRPLLALDRACLAEYARTHALDWVEDPSNTDLRRARNAIRHRVIPALAETSPGLRERLLDSVPAARAARDALAAQAREDLCAARVADLRDPLSADLSVDREPRRAGATDDRESCVGDRSADTDRPSAHAAHAALDRRVIAALDPARRVAALRAWIRGIGLRAPSRARLAEIEKQLLDAYGPHGRVNHDGFTLLRDRDTIRAIDASVFVRALRVAAPAAVAAGTAAAAAKAEAAATAPSAATAAAKDACLGERSQARVGMARRAQHKPAEPSGERVIHWNGEPALAIPGFAGRLSVEPVDATTPGAICAGWLAAQAISVTPGGRTAVRLRLATRGHRRTLKNLYQELGIPAWARAGLPLFFAGERLLHAAGVGTDRDTAPPPSTHGAVVLRWKAATLARPAAPPGRFAPESRV